MTNKLLKRALAYLILWVSEIVAFFLLFYLIYFTYRFVLVNIWGYNHDYHIQLINKFVTEFTIIALNIIWGRKVWQRNEVVGIILGTISAGSIIIALTVLQLDSFISIGLLLLCQVVFWEVMNLFKVVRLKQ